MMKKIFINISLLLSLVITFSSCKKKLADEFNNPELSTKPSIPNFFTAMLNNDRVRPAYWNLRTYLLLQPGVYSQTAAFDNASGVYQQNDGYTGNYWTDFYYASGNGSGVMALYRSIEKTYNGLSAADQATQKVFLEAAKVVLYDQTSKMVDAWGDIPFSQAGNLETNSAIKDAAFDDAKSIYTTCISGLDEAATFFGASTTASTAGFKKQDILLQGSLDMWRRYANSIRLRMLMRMSFLDEATAKTAVNAMLSNTAAYPLIDGGSVANYSPASSDVLLQPLTTNQNTLLNAFTEGSSFYAPDYMLNTAMLPANDPRIPVVFDKFGKTVNGVFVPNATYKAMPITFTSDQQSNNYTSYSTIDSATFLNNLKLPGVVITASEVNFLKAEALERWGSSSAAETAYNTAVSQSVAFYYYLNNLGGGKVAAPDAPTLAAFLNNTNVAYAGTTDQKLAKIWLQKWVHFGVLQSDEAWSEYRRTKFPQLTFVTQTQNGYQLPPTRLVYPSIETAYNSHYSAVQAKDTRTTKIFWDVK
ncbi:SusD/RagB family nutrient-binding outer membrane lipoprotein [Mucilaginibacter sp. OK098]|uniref:SusD/RagB family nutrient-binding outer membrane lipoprotein n=1 Tax=Mucilaginibacter sp. OK098 TaxID=1855297 RepID=UPI001F416735|nr:SusD/RagB family nutrient-binding outer membrane lipoprotein [Mucilaginibacter sp. OK098]